MLLAIDIYNALNSSAVLSYNLAFVPGGTWLQPTDDHDAAAHQDHGRGRFLNAMRRHVALRSWLCRLSLAAFVCGVGCVGGRVGAAQKKVLVVYSTRRDAQIVAIGERELPRILEQGLGARGLLLGIHRRARFPDAAYQTAFRDFLLLKYKDVRFDAVIAVQDAALDFVERRETSCFPTRPWSSSRRPRVQRHRNATGLVADLNFG